MRALVTLAFGLAILTAAPASTLAQRVIHRVRFGDTLAGLAKTYYGSKRAAGLVALVNGRSDKSRLRAGERIRLPTAWVYVVPKRTTLKRLAKRLLGDSRRGFALRQFNRLRGRRVRAGQEILVPFVLTHIARRDETFVALAQRFYGDRRQHALISRYNSLRGSGPPPGRRLLIPIAHVRILRQRLSALTNERLLGVAASASKQREAIQEANALIRRGDYSRVPLRLLRMLAQDHSSDSYIADVFKLMAIAYVAQGQHDLAVRTFREALLRRPSLELDAVRDSPKVIRAFVDAKSAPEVSREK